MPRMAGGVKFEHGHRLVAEFVGLLTIVVAVWTWLADRRRWMRILTAGAVAGVIAQGVIGGIGVLKLLPPWVSTMHATFGQTMFCALAAIALFTSRSWLEEPAKKLMRRDALPLRRYCWILIGVLYVQLVLGAAFRHVWTKWGPPGSNRWESTKIVHVFLYPHILNALLVMGLLLYVSLRTLRRHSTIVHLRRPALWMLVLLVGQLALGVCAYVVRVVWGINEVQPTLGLVAITVAHLGVGALILAWTVILTIQAYRHSGDPAEVVPFNPTREVATA